VGFEVWDLVFGLGLGRQFGWGMNEMLGSCGRNCTCHRLWLISKFWEMKRYRHEVFRERSVERETRL
jgi:hypothetical protein